MVDVGILVSGEEFTGRSLKFAMGDKGARKKVGWAEATKNDACRWGNVEIRWSKHRITGWNPQHVPFPAQRVLQKVLYNRGLVYASLEI